MRKDGLLDVEGGGIHYLNVNSLPAKRPITLVTDIEYNKVTESGEHVIEIRLIDADGQDVMESRLLKQNFSEKATSFGFFTKLKPTFCKHGWYSVEIAVDRHHLATISLNIMPFDS